MFSGEKRKWCDMDTCGNRITASSLYKKKKGNM
ncbi:CGNR zinc finger domain-containing protein [Peribacillus alkalitolerans]